MPAPPQTDGFDSIVLIGSFNPAIFHPAWFARHGLIRDDEAGTAHVEIVHDDVVSLSLGWALVKAEQKRFVLQATEALEAPELLRDLAIGTFEILSHTPIRRMGINDHVHFEVASEEKWHSIGHEIVPQKNWNDVLQNPGMRSATVEGERPDGYKGCVRVTVEPSAKMSPGVFASVNDHFELDVEKDEDVEGSDAILEILKDAWEPSLARSKQILTHIREFAN